MTAEKLIKALRADMVANKAIARVDGKKVVVAKFVGTQMVLTPEGEKLAKEGATASNKPKARSKAKAPATQEAEAEAPASPPLEG